jgi:hypothetical protein
MVITDVIHENVDENGKTELGGAVYTNGVIIMSQENGGCSEPTCNCSNGYWITIMKPRTNDGIVSGIKVNFSNKEEYDEFIKNRIAFCDSK